MTKIRSQQWQDKGVLNIVIIQANSGKPLTEGSYSVVQTTQTWSVKGTSMLTRTSSGWIQFLSLMKKSLTDTWRDPPRQNNSTINSTTVSDDQGISRSRILVTLHYLTAVLCQLRKLKKEKLHTGS